MRRLILVAVLVGIAVTLVTTAAAATPVIGLKSFDKDTFTYTYELTLSEGDSLFALDILSDMTEPLTEPFWSYPSAPAGWNGSTTWGPPDAAHWTGTSLLQTPGTFEFQWIVPNSRPSSSPIFAAAQMWSNSQNFITQNVIAPTTAPEPGSLLSLGLLAAGLTPYVRRRLIK